MATLYVWFCVFVWATPATQPVTSASTQPAAVTSPQATSQRMPTTQQAATRQAESLPATSAPFVRRPQDRVPRSYRPSRNALIIIGVGVFVVGYGLAVTQGITTLAAAMNKPSMPVSGSPDEARNNARKAMGGVLLVPLLGPFLSLPFLAQLPVEAGAFFYDSFLGVLQLTGAALFLWGLLQKAQPTASRPEPQVGTADESDARITGNLIH